MEQAIPTIPLFVAIRQMREISALGGTFSIVFAGYNRANRKGTGLHRIPCCSLRRSATEQGNKYADHQLNLLDEATNSPRKCWQVLILYFNDQKITLDGFTANQR
jgi:hypothetical protein